MIAHAAAERMVHLHEACAPRGVLDPVRQAAEPLVAIGLLGPLGVDVHIGRRLAALSHGYRSLQRRLAPVAMQQRRRDRIAIAAEQGEGRRDRLGRRRYAGRVIVRRPQAQVGAKRVLSWRIEQEARRAFFQAQHGRERRRRSSQRRCGGAGREQQEHRIPGAAHGSTVTRRLCNDLGSSNFRRNHAIIRAAWRGIGPEAQDRIQLLHATPKSGK